MMPILLRTLVRDGGVRCNVQYVRNISSEIGFLAVQQFALTRTISPCSSLHLVRAAWSVHVGRLSFSEGVGAFTC